MNKIYQKLFLNVKKGGFTLIELLLVVLIIGILTAVSLPLYHKAVKKSRATQALVWVKRISDAEDVYYAANGKYTKCLNELDIDLTPFTSRSENAGCVHGLSQGKQSSTSFLRIQLGEYLGAEASNWPVQVYIGDYLSSGWGGYGVRLGYNNFEREPLSCIEFGCYDVKEGSFCRQVMGYTDVGRNRDCVRFFNK